jgi:hypothetical protein
MQVMNIKIKKSTGESLLKYTKKTVVLGKKTQICDK